MKYSAKESNYTYGNNIVVTNDEPEYTFDNSASYLHGAQVKDGKLLIIHIHHPNTNEPEWDGNNWKYPDTEGADEWSHTYDENKYKIEVQEEFDLAKLDELTWQAEEILKEYFERR